MSKFLNEAGLRQLIMLLKRSLSGGTGINVDSEGKVNVKIDDETIKVNSEGELEAVGGSTGSIIRKFKIVNKLPGRAIPSGDHELLQAVADQIFECDVDDVSMLFEIVNWDDESSVSYDDLKSYYNNGDLILFYNVIDASIRIPTLFEDEGHPVPDYVLPPGKVYVAKTIHTLKNESTLIFDFYCNGNRLILTGSSK